MEVGDFWASAAAMFGGSGNTFEKRERPLLGVSGSLKAISTKPTGGLNNNNPSISEKSRLSGPQ